MPSFVKKLGSAVKSYPFIYHSGLNIYGFFSGIFLFISNSYLKILEQLTPKGFFIQSVPDYVRTNYKSYKNDAGKYHAYQQTLYRDYTRIIHGKYLLDKVYGLADGDYAELGTYKGQFARFIFEHKHPSSKLYCFDTFEGFHKKDVAIEEAAVNITVTEGFFSDTSVENVKANILKGKQNSDQLVLVKGYFPETFDGYEHKKWRFVQLDADLYEPMKEGVKLFWPNIIPGGVLMIHDYYGGYAGTQKAIDDYFMPLGIIPMPLGDKAGTAVVFKTR